MATCLRARPDGEDAVEDREQIDETIRNHFDQVYAKLCDAAKENLVENVREAYETAYFAKSY